MHAVPTLDSSTLDAASGATAEAPVRDLRRVPIHPDNWYPLAWSREVKRGKTHGVRFAGEPIVLVRTESGAVFALEDRCAHRQVPLHQGVVDGESIRCCYHGWTYDCTGAYKTRRFGREIKCHYSFMHENLMDMNHQFLHRRQMGQMRARSLGRRRGEDWVEVDYTFARMEGKQPVGEALVFGQNRSSGGQNDKDVMTIRTEYPYQTLQIRTVDQTLVMNLWIVYVPLDAEQRTNRTFGLLSIKKPGIPGVLDLAWPLLVWFTERIFKEDREIVEAEQEAHDRQGADWNHEVFPVINELRDLLRECGAPWLTTDAAAKPAKSSMETWQPLTHMPR